MSFVVSARKYRPQNFDEVIGQDHIAQTLKNALKNDQLAHAFLFAGPRGVGKTTSARILAKVLNCENLQEGYKACGECNSCKAFTDNASFNIFELDAASNNSVEHIRALNEQVRFQPQQGSFKIYIIDEVHMLSQAAFNAFLKTLEEPPPYAKFILATTEKHKIIPTILSRCQIFDFKRILIPDIVNQLKAIAEKENRKIDDDALHLISQKADGAMRDALSIYDKVISSIEGEISYTEVADNLNVLDYDYYFKIIDAAVKEDLPTIMVIYDKIVKRGFEPEQFIPGLMSHLRDLLMIKDLKTAELLEVGQSLRERYESQAELTSSSFVLSALSILNQTDINLLRSQNKRLSVEIALSKITYMNRVIDKKKRVATNESKETTEIKRSSTPTEPVQAQESQQAPQPQEPQQVKAAQEAAKEANPVEVMEVEADKKPVSSPKKIVRKKSTAPKISVDIDSLVANIEEKENNSKDKEHPYSSEAIEAIFHDFKEQTESQSLKTALSYLKVRINEDEVTVLTPARIYVDFIKQELHLLEKIHDQYPEKDLKLAFEVSEETFPEYEPPKKPKMLTTKEKYDMLVSKNPNFEKLVDTFKLKITNQ
ncbi:MAG: DNA polymerase III subunit gamma/tau [Saprospiraceae bacterium]|nr:DNA polymerase III subunit gamma/tau [Saprospiraceae bacterium]